MNRPPPYRLPSPGPSGAGSLPRPPLGRQDGAAPPEESGWRGLRRIYKDVDWSVSYILFLLYFVIVVTYRFEGASFAIGGAVAGLIVEKGRRRLPYWMIWFLALLVWGMISYTQSPLPAEAWEDGVLEYAKLWLACLVAVNVLTNTARLRFFIVFFLFLYATHPVRGALFNTFVYGYSVDSRVVWNGAWANPNDMAALTFLPLGLAVGLLKDPSSWVRKGAWGAVVLLPIIILMTQSRGAFLAMGVFAMLTVFANLKKARGLVMIAVVGVGALFAAPEGTFDRFTDLTGAVGGGSGLMEANDSGSARQRMDIWKVSFQIINNYPIFGVGLSAYPLMHGRTVSGAIASSGLARGRRDAHSTFIRVAAETGYPGFFFFITPFIIGIARSVQTRRKHRRAFPTRASTIQYVEAGLLAYLACAVFGSYAHTVFIWLALGILILLTEDLRSLATRGPRLGPDRRAFMRGHVKTRRPVETTA